MDVDVLNEDKVNSQSLELSKKPKYIMQYVPLYEDVDTYAYNKFSLEIGDHTVLETRAYIHNKEFQGDESTNKFYLQYKEFLNSLPPHTADCFLDNTDISVDTLASFGKDYFKAESLLSIFHRSLILAINEGFKNGSAKWLLQNLIYSFMITNEADRIWRSPLVVVNRDCYYDGFLIRRKKKRSLKAVNASTRISRCTSKNSGSSESATAVSNSVDDSRSSSKVHYNEDHRFADVVAMKYLEAHDLFVPHCIIECKDSSSVTEVREAMAQVLSYGLSLRHFYQLSFEIDLLIITPKIWCTLILPPFNEKVCGALEFQKFHVFSMDMKMKSEKKFFSRRVLLNFLSYISRRGT